MERKSHPLVYGFEDCNVITPWEDVFTQTWNTSFPFQNCSTDIYLINKNLSVKVNKSIKSYGYTTASFEPDFIEHKELLDTAKKVYIHPACKLSRSMVAEKYKKSLNPYMADAVVIPRWDCLDISIRDVAVFANDKAKLIIVTKLLSEEEKSYIAGFNNGDTYGSMIRFCHVGPTYGYEETDLLNAELVYVGEMLFMPNSYEHVFELLTNALPVDKLVFEDTLQESLGSESNKLSFESLLSIKDMLESSDEGVVAAALKALSMMDWMHYSNSVKYILNAVSSQWKWNKATDSTSVRYMLKSLSNNSSRGRWPGSYSDSIYKEDYELYKQLKMHFTNTTPETVMNELRFLEFMTVVNNVMVPRLKQST